MEQSIRNQLPGTVKSVVSDKVLSEVIVETSIGEVASVITTRSVEEMKLKAGDHVFVLVKATNVSLLGAANRESTQANSSLMKTKTLVFSLPSLCRRQPLRGRADRSCRRQSHRCDEGNRRGLRKGERGQAAV